MYCSVSINSFVIVKIQMIIFNKITKGNFKNTNIFNYYILHIIINYQTNNRHKTNIIGAIVI